MRILIVDDDQQVRNCLSAMLSRFGPIDEAGNGRDGVSKFVRAWEEGKPYGLILMDFEMPVMNGSEALHMIRLFERDHPVPNHVTTVLIISGRNDSNIIFADAISADPNLHLLSKPIDFQKLIQLLTPGQRPGAGKTSRSPWKPFSHVA